MPSRSDPRGYLYFIRSLTMTAVKVGFAVDPSRRLGTLQTGNPNKLYMGQIVPIEYHAERAFHDIMRPHRVTGEWYPDDTLLTCLEGNLIEAWGDKVQEADGGSHDAWLVDGNEWTNPSATYLTEPELRTIVLREIDNYFSMTDEDWDNDPPAPITNHWLPKPVRKTRKLRSGYA